METVSSLEHSVNEDDLHSPNQTNEPEQRQHLSGVANGR